MWIKKKSILCLALWTVLALNCIHEASSNQILSPEKIFSCLNKYDELYQECVQVTGDEAMDVIQGIITEKRRKTERKFASIEDIMPELNTELACLRWIAVRNYDDIDILSILFYTVYLSRHFRKSSVNVITATVESGEPRVSLGPTSSDAQRLHKILSSYEKMQTFVNIFTALIEAAQEEDDIITDEEEYYVKEVIETLLTIKETLRRKDFNRYFTMKEFLHLFFQITLRGCGLPDPFTWRENDGGNEEGVNKVRDAGLLKREKNVNGSRMVEILKVLLKDDYERRGYEFSLSDSSGSSDPSSSTNPSGSSGPSSSSDPSALPGPSGLPGPSSSADPSALPGSSSSSGPSGSSGTAE